MRLDGHYVAVVDRFEDGQGVLLVEKDDEVVEEILVEPEDLPEDARHQDAVLEIMLDTGNLRNAEFLPEETERRTADAQDRFDRLSQRPPGSDDRPDSADDADARGDTDSLGDADPGEDSR